MERKENASLLFEGNYNCAQAVLASYADDFGLDKDLAVSLASGFGSGISRSGQVCGAVTGACMVIGLQYGSKLSEESSFQERKEKTYLLVAEILDKFKERNGSITCRGLIGYDLDDPNQHAEAKLLGIFTSHCNRFVRDSVELTEGILRSIPEEVS